MKERRGFFEKHEWILEYVPQDAKLVTYAHLELEPFTLTEYEFGSSTEGQGYMAVALFFDVHGNWLESFPRNPETTEFSRMRWKTRFALHAQDALKQTVLSAARMLSQSDQLRVRFIIWIKVDTEKIVDLHALCVPKRKTLKMMVDVMEQIGISLEQPVSIERGDALLH